MVHRWLVLIVATVGTLTIATAGYSFARGGSESTGASFAGSPGCTAQPSGLVSWWSGDGSANDVVGTNNGALQNGASFGAGMVGQAFNFDGVDDFVQAPTDGFPTGTSDRTVELWAKMDAFVAGEAFMAGYGSFGSPGQVFAFGSTSKDHNRVLFSTWGPAIFGPILDTGTWYHVAVTSLGNTQTLYLDGVPVASGVLAMNTSVGTPFYIGQISGDSYRRLQGEVDEISVYDRALSAQEVQAIFNAGSAGKCTTPPPPDQQLANMFSPVLMESGDDYKPEEVGIMTADKTGAAQAKLARHLYPDIANPMLSDLCANPEQANYLDINGPTNAADFRHTYSINEGAFTDTVYSRIYWDPQDNTRVAAIQYWLFYFYDRWKNSHEGDWEQITLTFEPSATPSEILGGNPAALPHQAGYSQHTHLTVHGFVMDGTRASWSTATGGAGTHPRVHVATGSHANYFNSRFYDQRHIAGVIGDWDEATGTIVRQRPQLAVSLLPPISPCNWLDFSGLWGETSIVPGNSGPKGPSQQKDPWDEPVGWVRSLPLDSDKWPDCSSLPPMIGGLPCRTTQLITLQSGQTVELAANVQVGREARIAVHSGSGGAAGAGIAGISSNDFSVSLLSPTGRVIDANTVAPDVDHETGNGYDVYYIENPEAGDWTVNVYGANVPPGGTDVSVSVTTDPATTPPDIDGDSCTNDAELQIAVGSQSSGGLRDPLNPWDYFNPTRDGKNRVDDILLVVHQFFKDIGNPAYNPDTDRTLVGPNAWNLGPPDGLQRVDDILNEVHQFFHDCS